MLKLLEIAVKNEISSVDHATIFEMVGMSQTVSTPNQTEIATIIREVSGLVKSNDIQKKKLGLSWLSEIVKQSSSNTFDYFSPSWLKLVIETLVVSPGIYRDECFNIISEMAKRLRISTSDCSEQLQQLHQRVIPEILKTNSSDKFIGHLNCLKAILQNFPTICKNQFENIEKYLMSPHQSFNYEGIQAVALCMKYLPSAFGEQSTSVWRRQFDKVMNSLMKLMTLFYRVIHTELEIEIGECYELPDIQHHKLPFLSLSRSVNMFAACIIEMLNVDYVHTVVSTQPKQIIAFIRLVFEYSPQISQNDRLADNKDMWFTIIPTILKITLQLMENLILNCPQILYGYAADIFSLLIRKLKAISMTENVRILKCNVYNVLSVFINKLPDIYIENHLPSIVNLLIEDIQPNVEKNHKHKISNSALNFSASEHIHCQTNLSAIKVLSALINTKRFENIQNISEEILRIFDALFLSSSYPVPYNNSSCRYELYNVLFCCMNNLASLGPQNFSIALHIFSRGRSDDSVQISSFCEMAYSLSNNFSILKSPVLDENESDHFDIDMPPPRQELFVEHSNIDAIPVSFFNANSQDPEDSSVLNNHNEDMEDEESVEDEQMENEESGEEGEEDEEECEEDYDEDEEEYEEQNTSILEMDSPTEKKSKEEKPPVDNGYFAMQNGTVSSDEGAVPIKEKRKIEEKSEEFYVSSPQTKKLKNTDECSQDGSLSDQEAARLNSMMADFIDKPPDEEDENS